MIVREGTTDVCVTLVGFNSLQNLDACLTSLLRTEWQGYRASIVFVDNASSDGSVEWVRAFDSRIHVIANQTNLGFCDACNQAAEWADSRYIFLLNNDATVEPDTIPKLLNFLDANPEIGAAGSRLLNPDGTDQWSARRFPAGVHAFLGRRSVLAKVFPNARGVRHYLYKDELERGEPFSVDWVPGSCTLVRREAFNQVGGLPPGMHYWSDAVFCYRLRKAGWPVYTVPESRLTHSEGHGTGRKNRALRAWLIQDFHQGAYRFYCEHRGLKPGSLSEAIARGGLHLRSRLLIWADRLAAPRE